MSELQSLRDYLAPFIAEERKRMGPAPSGHALSSGQRVKKFRAKRNEERERNVAILDMETDPFDRELERIHPFAAELYSDQFEPIVIWELDPDRFIEKVVAAIQNLPGKFTIYAHNGGKFDFLFFVHRLRGDVSFKGRGVMRAHIGEHELRDSFHILPDKLGAFQKDEFNYDWMLRKNRKRYKREILDYLHSDCVYTFRAVKAFIAENGFKLSIGQAAVSAASDAGCEVETISEWQDGFLRKWYFGGRVECLEGQGEFVGDFKLIDVNSMYPYVMAHYKHPVGAHYIRRKGEKPGKNTIFLELSCVNHGALVVRDPDTGETTPTWGRGTFYTTIFEYNVALNHGLIDDVEIIECIDNLGVADFSAFVNPAYAKRQELKAKLATLQEGTEEHFETKMTDTLVKFYLNNCYGKYAQNPRRFKEVYLTDYGEKPPAKWMAKRRATLKLRDPDAARIPDFPVYQNEEMNYAIWERPVEKWRFANVGTSASITGAARAVLLDALCRVERPIYCDTDSIICAGIGDLALDKTELGAWDLEDSFTAVRIAGKKLYGCARVKPKKDKNGNDVWHKSASKGVSGVTWDELGQLIEGAVLTKLAKGPTLTRRLSQSYNDRDIRATAKGPNVRLLNRLAERAA